jgi:hypothetical protein
LLQGKLSLICGKLYKLQGIEVNYKAESEMVKRTFHSGETRSGVQGRKAQG